MLRDIPVRLLTHSRVLKSVSVLVALVPFLLSYSVTVDGRLAAPLLVVIPLVTIAVGIRQERDFWQLERSQRRAVVETTLTGAPTGDPDVDAVALTRLDRAASVPPWANRLIGAVVLLMMIAAPIVAAVRSSTWWLVCLVGVPLMFAVTPVAAFTSNARVRLALMEAAFDDPIDG